MQPPITKGNKAQQDDVAKMWSPPMRSTTDVATDNKAMRPNNKATKPIPLSPYGGKG